MSTDELRLTAPDFTPGYPSGGETIGPAWAVLYHALPDRLWVRPADVAEEYAAELGISPRTVDTLLRAAAHHGVIEWRRITVQRRTIAQCRRGRGHS